MNLKGVTRFLSLLGVNKEDVKVSDAWVTTKCPLAPWTHSKRADRTPSFGISIAEGPSGYNCFTCGEKGPLSRLVETLSEYREEDLSHLSAYLDDNETYFALLPWSDVTSGKDLPEPKDEKEHDDLFPPAWRYRKPVHYFTKVRGVSRSIMQELDLRWDSYRNRVLFKAKVDGEFYGSSGRSILKNPKRKIRVYKYSREFFLLNEDRIQDSRSRPLVVIEGLMGIAELMELGLEDYADVVAIQGSKLSKHQAARLVELDRPTIIMLDNDEAGRLGTYGGESAQGKRVMGALERLEGAIDAVPFLWPRNAEDYFDMSPRKLRRLVDESLSLNL